MITAYFDEKGLVRQQLSSFDDFIQNSIQEIVDQSQDIVLIPEPQHIPGQTAPDLVRVPSLVPRCGTLVWCSMWTSGELWPAFGADKHSQCAAVWAMIHPCRACRCDACGVDATVTAGRATGTAAIQCRSAG